jgi:hypothetical protein
MAEDSEAVGSDVPGGCVGPVVSPFSRLRTDPRKVFSFKFEVLITACNKYDEVLVRVNGVAIAALHYETM